LEASLKADASESTVISLEDMYEEYFSKIYNLIYFRILSKEQTEDLVSEVFLKVVRNYDKFDADKASLKTWIFTITNNTLIDYYRRKKEHASLDCDSVSYLPQIDSDELELIRSEDRKILHKVLLTLDERTRAVISLRYFADMSIREISAHLHMNESSVSTLHVRGLKKLRSILNEDFF
jgi:RNA polymerase sigma-70 factor (ECF subfamily)